MLRASTMFTCVCALVMLLVADAKETSCICLTDSSNKCPNVTQDSVCPMSLIGKFLNVEYFFWRQYGANAFLLIETTHEDVLKNMQGYPCSYYTGGSRIKEFYFRKMGSTTDVKVSGVDFPYPDTTYSSNTYFYSYCHEPQQFITRAMWQFKFTAPPGTSHEYNMSQGTDFAQSEAYFPTWVDSVNRSMQAGVKVPEASGGPEGGATASATFADSAFHTISSEVGKDNATSQKIKLDLPADGQPFFHGQHAIWQFCVSTQRNYCGHTMTTTCSSNLQVTGDQLIPPRCLPGFCQDDACQICMDNNHSFPKNTTELIISNFKVNGTSDTSCWLDNYPSQAWAYDCLHGPTGCSPAPPAPAPAALLI